MSKEEQRNVVGPDDDAPTEADGPADSAPFWADDAPVATPRSTADDRPPGPMANRVNAPSSAPPFPSDGVEPPLQRPSPTAAEVGNAERKGAAADAAYPPPPLSQSRRVDPGLSQPGLPAGTARFLPDDLRLAMPSDQREQVGGHHGHPTASPSRPTPPQPTPTHTLPSRPSGSRPRALPNPPPSAALPPGPERLTEDMVLRPRKPQPMEGWRAWLYKISGGAINIGPSRRERAWNALIERCQSPCPDGRRIAVISRKGGVGKTTTTLMIGHTLAALRPDRVMAIDGNPDAGTLGHRIRSQTDATVIETLSKVGSIRGYPDARAFTSQAPSRLEILASPEDPHASRALRGQDYQAVMDELDHHYNVMLCDTGTGIMDDANLGILDAIDQIVLVTGTALDSARAASMTLDWLESHGRGQLVRDGVVVVNAISELGRVDIDQVVRHFANRTRAVHRIPHDRHLEAGSITDPDRLAPATQEAWLSVAATVVDGFALPSARTVR